MTVALPEGLCPGASPMVYNRFKSMALETSPNSVSINNAPQRPAFRPSKRFSTYLLGLE